MSIVTYEQRVAKIDSIEELENQIRLSREYVRKIQRELKNFEGSFDQKLAINRRLKDAEVVVRKLRFNSFDIEDKLLGITQASAK